MSSNITRPTRPQPQAVGGVQPPTRPSAAPTVQRPAPPQPSAPVAVEPDPFESDVPTSGVPLEEAAELDLRGSQIFGQPPTESGAVGEFDLEGAFGDDAESMTATAEDDGEGEDWGDDAPEAEGQEETGAIAAAPETDPFDVGEFGEEETAVTFPPTPVVAPPSRPTGVQAPGGRKAFQLLQGNGSVVFDTKLMMNLASIEDAIAAWDTLYKPYLDLTEAERYTRYCAGEILVRDREERFKAAKLLAKAILDESLDDPGEGDVEVTMRLGKDEAQAETQPDLGLTQPTTKHSPNTMMEKCHNHAVGCNSMRLNHLQGTGSCFYPECPCKGRCQAYVAPTTGGETTQGETKSTVVQPSQQPVPANAGTVPPTRADAGAGSRVVAPAQKQQTDPRSANSIQTPDSLGQTRSTTPVQQGAQPSTAQAGGTPAGGGSGQPQDRASAQGQRQPTAGGQPSSGVGTQGTQPVAHTAQSAVQANAAGGQSQQGQRPVAQTQRESQAVREARTEEEPLITGDLLTHIVMNGGRGPEHSDYWPAIPTDPDDKLISRRQYIQNRFIKFWENATQKEVPSGNTGKSRVLNTQDFKLNSTSYRVVLAANKVAEAIEMFTVAPKQVGYIAQPRDAQNLSPTDKEIIQNVIVPAVTAYVEAHRPLPAGQMDATWSEYLEYCEAFKDEGLQKGMLIHLFQTQQQAQG